MRIPLVRWGAAYAIGGVKDPQSISNLKKTLNSEDSGEIRKWIVYAVGEIGGEDAIRSLHDVLKIKDKKQGKKQLKDGLYIA